MKSVAYYLKNLAFAAWVNPKYLGYLNRRYGWWQSFKSRQATVHDTPVPWITYAALSYLKAQDFSELRVLEFGSGNSTSWWCRRAKEVVSVEHDRQWFSRIPVAPNLTTLLRETAETYTDIDGQFDVVVIDGAFRSACHAQVLRWNPRIIIVDNTDWFPSLASVTGYTRMDFTGPGPINHYCWTTTVLVRR
jgi:hypothetical protein